MTDQPTRTNHQSTRTQEVRARTEAVRALALRERARQALPESAEAEVGIIGGSGLYDFPGIADVVEVKPSTPFGAPSDAIVVGTLEGRRVAFLARHGRGHRLLPSEVPNRANLWSLRLLGIGQAIGISACGSMREEIAPRDVVVPDQLIDRALGRPHTFFGQGVVAHVGLADPFCPDLSARTADAARQTAGELGGGRSVHDGGAYITIEGPQFSTRAESAVHRDWGVAVVGMTAAPEVKLAREAEICFALLAMATDYDVWHETEKDVTTAEVLANMAANIEVAQGAVRRLLGGDLGARDTCPCPWALDGAVQTVPEARSPQRMAELSLLLGDGSV
jgi:5'-methylthioadenosine phosphorylase